MSDSTSRERAALSPTSPRTYAIGDVHGRLDLLERAVEVIAAHVGEAPFRVIFLGDYVDRGPDSRGVIDLLIDLQRRWPVVCLKGNHEELMLQALTQPGGGRLSRWLEYGGDHTLASYGLDETSDLAEGIPREHVRWMSGLPRTTGDGHRIYVHAGLAPGTPIHRQKEQTFLWIRERFLQAKASEFEAHVVHGHTPIWEGKPDPAEPELLDHRTNIDTAAFATGVLSIAVFHAERPGGPVDVLQVRGKAVGRIVPEDPGDEPAPATAEPEPPRKRRFGGWFGRRAAGNGSR
ncbi:MAG TPA: metallophosphoesterase [Caulobacteraceae bacterium]|jgi:serine/threonine protein phosphatase 1|nr:metallophosphoesterase [Caulobacteraceae bacterium]